MRIAIITNVTKDVGLKTAMAAAELLFNKAEIYMSDECVLQNDFDIKYVPNEKLWEYAEVMLVIGGDGTLLGVAAKCAKYGIPALGINLGKVGFLTEVEPCELKNAIAALTSGDYVTEKRMMIKMQVNNENASYHALNDIVISKPEGTRLISLDLYTNDELVNHYVGDGLIIATPTGSTGYSISAGGPVVDPRMSLYVATPICAHMLAVRSAVLPGEKDIVIRLGRDYANNLAIITTDGERQRFISPYDTVRISKSCYEFELIRIGTSSFYSTLLSKLS